MKKEVARDILASLLTPKIMDAIYAYADDRIETLRVQLETAKDEVDVRQLQGAIQEARRLKTIRDTAIAVMEQGMKRNG